MTDTEIVDKILHDIWFEDIDLKGVIPHPEDKDVWHRGKSHGVSSTLIHIKDYIDTERAKQ